MRKHRKFVGVALAHDVVDIGEVYASRFPFIVSNYSNVEFDPR